MNKLVVKFLPIIVVVGLGLAAPVVGQTVPKIAAEPLVYQLRNFPLVKPKFSDKAAEYTAMTDQLGLLLSVGGSIKFDDTNATFTVHDTADRQAIVAEVLAVIDTPPIPKGVSADAFVTQTATVHTKYLLPFFSCRGVAGEPGVRQGSALEKEHSWIDRRGDRVAGLLTQLLRPTGSLEFRHERKEFGITVIPERINLIRRVIELCDTPPPKFD